MGGHPRFGDSCTLPLDRRMVVTWIWFVGGGSVCSAVRLCVDERVDGLLVAWRFYDCVLNCSSTLRLLPFTVW